MAGLEDAATELEALAFRLRRAGEEELLREVTKAMRDAVVPVPDEIRANAEPHHIPKRYAAELDADVHIGINVRTTGSDPGVSVTGQPRGKARKLRDLDAGRLTHPLFGDRSLWTHAPRQVERKLWFTQEKPSVQPGWFTGPAEAAAPRVLDRIEKALQDVANRAAGR